MAAIEPTLTKSSRRFSPPGLGSVLRWIAVALGAVLFVFPIYWMMVTAITPQSVLLRADYSLLPRSFQFGNFATAWHQFPWAQWYQNSFFIAIIAVAVTVFINLLAGYTFAKLRFPGRNLLFFLIIAMLTVPTQVLMIPQFRIVVDMGLLNSPWGVIIPRLAEAFGLFLSRQFFSALPDELIEAARIDGASEFRIFSRVILPLAKPLIAVLVIFTFQYRWNEFVFPLLVLRDFNSLTVPVGVLFARGQNVTDYNLLMSSTLLSIVPMLIIFLLFQRYFVEGMARSGLK